MRQPPMNLKIFSERRNQLAHKAQEAAVIVASHPEYIRSNDSGHSYRPDSNLYYLTGFDEPESVLLFRPGCNPETVMFVRPRDKEKETWNGFRFGPEGVEKNFKIDKTYTINEFVKEAPALLQEVDKIYYRHHKNPQMDQLVDEALQVTSKKQGRSGFGLLPVFDADELLGEMRVIKSTYEIEQLRQACDISAEAHIAAMKFTRPGVSELQVHAVLLHHMMMKGCQRDGYGAIVASGDNATILHYHLNENVCKNGELLLIDYGGEFNYYTADITRTFPVNGKFTPAQASVYQGVLSVQKKLIEMVRPGLPYQELHDTTVSLLTDVMLDLGLFSGRKSDIIESKQYMKYYPHGSGHYLGMDVHDAGMYKNKKDKSPRLLEAGMCLTIEPGLYFPPDDTDLPKELRGIGVRIEDDILVTQQGHDVLSKKAPKEIADLEAIVGR